MKPQIIYIIGAGRSGSTLLDIILGNANNIFSAGELNRFTKRKGIPHNPRDNAVNDFWKDIRIILQAKGYNNNSDLYKLSKAFEYHSSFLNIFLSYNKQKFNKYKEFQKSLFEAIQFIAQKKFNKTTIVDSSKYPVRGYFLSKVFGKDISFICLQRNPLSVVDSFQKKHIEQPSKNKYSAHLYLLAVNKLSLFILTQLKKNNKVCVVNYEYLVENPLMALSQIEKDLNIDLSEPKKKINEKQPLKVGYLFDGNRLRLENNIVLKKTLPKSLRKKGWDYIFEKLHKITWYKKKDH